MLAGKPGRSAASGSAMTGHAMFGASRTIGGPSGGDGGRFSNMLIEKPLGQAALARTDGKATLAQAGA